MSKVDARAVKVKYNKSTIFVITPNFHFELRKKLAYR